MAGLRSRAQRYDFADGDDMLASIEETIGEASCPFTRSLPSLRELLLWGRRRYKSGRDPTWYGGVVELVEVERTIIDLWAHEDIDLEENETVELFTLLILNLREDTSDGAASEGRVASSGRDRGLSGETLVSTQTLQRSHMPVLSALHASVTCREHARSITRDTGTSDAAANHQ